MRQHIGTQLHQVQALLKEGSSAKNLQNTREQLETLRGQYEALRTENTRLASQVAALESERDSLLNRVAALQRVSPSFTNKEPGGRMKNSVEKETAEDKPPEPGWMAAWRQTETYERDASILVMIGKTGLARRPVIEAQAAEMLGIKKAGGSIQALITRLVELQLLEIFRPWTVEGAGTGGRNPDLVRLAERGQTAYWLLTGSQPVANEYNLLLERHVSPEHTLLNL